MRPQATQSSAGARAGQEVLMDETIQVEAARIPDRDRLLRALEESGIEARAVDEVGIEVAYRGDSAQATDDLFAHVESLVFELGEPFVPAKKDGVVYLRPPGD
jgi:hypothetical protein